MRITVDGPWMEKGFRMRNDLILLIRAEQILFSRVDFESLKSVTVQRGEKALIAIVELNRRW